MPVPTTDEPPALAAGPAAEGAPACRNCGAPLLGPHCYACGQPVKGLVRHFSSLVGDFLDTVFEWDSRTLRTLGPLFLRPGWLSCEYFEGRQVRYVSPLRLFFFLSIVTFLVAQFTLSVGEDPIRVGGDDAIASATTAADVEQRRDALLAELARARAELGDTPAAANGLRKAEEKVRQTAQARLRSLSEAEALGVPPPAPEKDTVLTFGDLPWDARSNPVAVAWLPDFANDWLNAQAGRANDNIGRLRNDPDQYKNALLGAVPSTLFVLLPVFALLLKLAYLFKRRLYMEHLIVALHSHAFLCLSLLLALLTIAARDWLAPAEGGLRTLLGWVEGLLFAWMPLYLLLMQKRVYGQGWPMTLLKYAVLGICYLVLLGFGAAATAVASLVWM